MPSADLRPEALDQLPVAIWFYDRRNNFIRWGNRRALDFWQVPDRAALAALDLSDTRDVTRSRLQILDEQLADGGEVTRTWTVYPGGVPKTVAFTSWRVVYHGHPCIAFMALPEAASQVGDEVAQRDRILAAIVRSAERMLHNANWMHERARLLEEIGRAAGVDRCYYFRFEPAEAGAGRWLASQEYEWCAPGVTAQIDNPELQRIDLVSAGFERWIDRFRTGRPVVAASLEQVPDGERELLQSQGIQALCVHPVIIDDRVWGIIGFDIVDDSGRHSPAPPGDPADRQGFAGWTSPVVDALSMAAHLLAAGRTMHESRLQLISALEQTHRANAAKSEFLANVSHELRTPLNAIIGFSQMMRAEVFGPIEPTRYRAYIEDISASSQHLLRLVNDILDIERALAGELALEEHVASLRTDIVDPAIRLAYRRAESNRVTIESQQLAGETTLRLDTGRIVQVLVNLLSNAVKFSPDDGWILLRTRLDAAGNVLIDIIDRGIGMTPQQIALALQPFGQVAAAHVATPGGAGIGLPLCKQIIQLHGGSLELFSEPKAGTRATVTLPHARRIDLPSSPRSGQASDRRPG